MCVFDVNSEGVSFAMPFIWGLSTMATLIVPPFVPDAGVPLLPEDDLLSLLDPPQPAAASAMTVSTATAAAIPLGPVISLSSCSQSGGQRHPSALGDL